MPRLETAAGTLNPHSQEVSLTPEQQARLRQIDAVRAEIRLFDFPPHNVSRGGPLYYDRWVRNRPYKTKEEAVQVYAELLGIPLTEVSGLLQQQAHIRAIRESWDHQRMHSVSVIGFYEANARYWKTAVDLRKSRMDEQAIVDKAVRGLGD